MSILPTSLPKQIEFIQFKEFNVAIAPWEKISALWHANNVGSSITKSTPFSTAALARVYLSNKAGYPLCRKLPLIIETVWVALVISFDFNKWYKCPLWNGLYSTTNPSIFIKFLLLLTIKVSVKIKLYTSYYINTKMKESYNISRSIWYVVYNNISNIFDYICK